MADEFNNENLEEKTPETVTSEETDTEIPKGIRKKKYITLDETITLQAIICVMISILFVAVNMFAPDISEALSEEFKENYYLSSEKTDEVIDSFLEFINSKPVSYD